MRDEATFALVAAYSYLKHGQWFFVWNFEPTRSLDNSENSLYWAELGVIEVLVIRLDLEVSIVLFLFDTKLEIKNIIHYEIREVTQRLLVLVEEFDVVQDERVRGWARPAWMGDLQVLLLRDLAPFNATVANETAQIDPVNQGGIQRIRIKICPEEPM